MSKVLIISSSFTSGDAITIMNLFSKWNRSDLFLATPAETPYAKFFNKCYYLGVSEQTAAFPFRFFLKISDSHVIDGDKQNLCCSAVNPKSLKGKIYKKYILPILKYSGLYDKRIVLSLSSEFMNWLDEIKPDIIYSPVSNGIMLNFLLQCQEKLPNIKFAIHGFDDWFRPSYRVAFRKYFIQKLEIKYKFLIDRANYVFTTSDMMNKEYHRRYGIYPVTFHNAVDLTYIDAQAKCFNDGLKHITYIGKVHTHNAKALRNMQRAIHLFNSTGYKKLILDIYTQTHENDLKRFGLCTGKNMKIHSPIPNSSIIPLLKGSDLLFLPISISRDVAAFTKFSMSTKMGEYLSSGTPMIYCGPDQIAMTEMLKYDNVALLTTMDGPQPLLNLLYQAFNQTENLFSMTERGVEIAKKRFNKENISKEFHNILK